ncbi:MAG TPA: sigma-54 dependent transcriptional regulator [Gammaproteobacteria bacterium]|nr:sigma-54 dependent transcriptional regulator [Gammaproteobacteria bacterium]
MARVLLVDDEPDFVTSASEMLRLHGHDVRTADTLANARRLIESQSSDVLLLDLMLPDGNGLELLEELAENQQAIERVVLITGHPGIKSQIKNLSGPSVSYLTKPIDSRELMGLLRELERSDKGQGKEGQDVEQHFGLLVGETPQMHAVYDQIEKIAPTDSAVLILGETGTGKELVAEAIHRASSRTGEFVAVNCGSLSRELAGSELFGHEKGSFTGATRQHSGFFQRAHSGTLFLDELTEMPSELQPHFLRVLETRRVLPVGSEKEIAVETRVIAATNRVPTEAITNKALRKDLYYRLSIFPINLPPLHSRRADIPLLAKHFLQELTRRYGPEYKLSEKSMKRLEAYHWPGNVRELRHVIHRAFILSDSENGELELPERFESPFGQQNRLEGLQVGRSIRDIERELIMRTLAHFDGDKRAAAEILGISLNTLYNRLHVYEQEKAS